MYWQLFVLFAFLEAFFDKTKTIFEQRILKNLFYLGKSIATVMFSETYVSSAK